ncbi:MAG: HlyD family secretion protein [Peptococcaceae bacterium]
MAKIKRIAVLIVALGLLSGSFWIWQTYFKTEQGGIQATGTIEATSVDLNAKLAGTIKVLSLNSGDLVNKGQLVAELSRNDLVAQRERDELSVVKSEANLADLLSGAREQELKEAEANVNIARANLDQAAEDLARLKTLVAAGAVTQVEYEQVQTKLEVGKNQLAAAEARFSLLQAGSRQEVLKGAQLEIERNKAVLKATEAMLADLKIYSPANGVVLSKNYELGEYVTPGAALATVVDMDDLWIKVYIPTDDLPQVTLGQKVSFTVSGRAESFAGIVEEIATKGEFTPKTIQTKKERTNVVFAVKIRISSADGLLKPGMPADVIFSGESRDD